MSSPTSNSNGAEQAARDATPTKKRCIDEVDDEVDDEENKSEAEAAPVMGPAQFGTCSAACDLALVDALVKLQGAYLSRNSLHHAYAREWNDTMKSIIARLLNLNSANAIGVLRFHDRMFIEERLRDMYVVMPPLPASYKDANGDGWKRVCAQIPTKMPPKKRRITNDFYVYT